MINRTRNCRIEIKLSSEEMSLFKEKLTHSHSKNMTEFLIKCVSEEHIYIIDMQVFRELQHLLANIANNTNQIAKHVNTHAVIYREDVELLKKLNTDFSLQLQNILHRLKSIKIKRR